MDNQRISDIFCEIANLLEMQGEDPFRIRAYRRASQTISHFRSEVRFLAQAGRLEEIPGVGKILTRDITQLIDTGSVRYHEHLKSTVPAGLLPILRLPSLTTAQVRLLWRKYDVTSMQQLIRLYREHRLPFEADTLEALSHDLNTWERDQRRMLLGMALPRAELLVQNLQRISSVERISIAGSLRRGVDLVGDMNIVMATSDPDQLIQTCTQQPEVRQVLFTQSATSSPYESGTSAASAVIITSEGLRVSLAAVLPSQYDLALLHFTGSKAHIAALGRLAQQRGLHLTATRLTRFRDHAEVPIDSEAAIYSQVGLPWIAPELREDTGEIEAAMTGSLPVMIANDGVLGDLHVHSNWGNGAHGLEDIATAAQRLGYQYAAICDYTYSPATGQGLTPEELRKQIVAIRHLNARLPSTFRLLASAEVEVSSDGDIHFDEDVLQELDLVVAAIHTGFKAPQNQITRRLCKAMEHPLVHILAHPSGRMLGRQESPAIDMDTILETAVETNTCLEINSHVLRLDLCDRYVRQAKDLGLLLALGSDAHSVQEMRTMRLGVITARRGWLEPRQLLNAMSYRDLYRHFHQRDAMHAL
jgi:DNA polymerase (family 10)